MTKTQQRRAYVIVFSIILAAWFHIGFSKPAWPWSHNPALNTPICRVSGDQQYPQIIPDGFGGAIITWEDDYSGNSDIYAQRVNALGAVQWRSNCVAICTASNYQYDPQITTGGSGGAIITWKDYSSDSSDDIYAQRVNASGARQWTARGVAICTAIKSQQNQQIISDGAGGAIITWEDYRYGGTLYTDIFAQRVNASGAPQWTANGVAICTASNSQKNPQIISDGAGGAIITWEDTRDTGSTGYTDIYAQRVNASGAPQWTANGVAICTASNSQKNQQIISDGAGGAIITWEDYGESGSPDIYAQRVNASGAPQWTANGVAICTASNSQKNQQIISDGAGGAIITWEDYYWGNADIYAQQIGKDGTLGKTHRSLPFLPLLLLE